MFLLEVANHFQKNKGFILSLVIIPVIMRGSGSKWHFDFLELQSWKAPKRYLILPLHSRQVRKWWPRSILFCLSSKYAVPKYALNSSVSAPFSFSLYHPQSHSFHLSSVCWRTQPSSVSWVPDPFISLPTACISHRCLRLTSPKPGSLSSPSSQASFSSSCVLYLEERYHPAVQWEQSPIPPSSSLTSTIPKSQNSQSHPFNILNISWNHLLSSISTASRVV